MADMILPFTLPFTLGGAEPETGVSRAPAAPAGATIDVTIRLQALDGTWETCGADRAVKVTPETVTFSHNEWGADKASFELRRSPIALWPDLGAFTPVEIEVGGVVVWEGRTIETPVRAGAEQVINVQCQGWQYHLDDDVFQRTYVHSKLTDWKDTRSFLEVPLVTYKQSGSVQSAQGRVTLGYQKGAQVAAGQGVGVTLDLGPISPGAVALSADVEVVGNPEGYLFYIIGHNGFNTAEVWNERHDFISAAGLANGTYNSVLVEPAVRHVSLLVWRSGAEQERAEDLNVIVKGVRVFTSNAWSASGVSVLKASQVAADALTRATTLLSADRSQIAATSFNIPDFVLSKASTAREAIEAANAYHNWISKILAGRRPSFQPRPTAPALEIGTWSRAQVEETSANNGAEIYSRALVEAAGADGSPMVAERASGQATGSGNVIPAAGITPDNPSFTTNTEHWTPGANAGIARSEAAGNFRSAPAGGIFAGVAASQVTTTISGTFIAGVTYLLTIWVKCSKPVSAAFGLIGVDEAHGSGGGTGEFFPLTLTWTPFANRTGVVLQLRHSALGGENVYLDDLKVQVIEYTLLNRRGFRRTKVIQMSSAITPVEGVQLADTFLQAHSTTPFKGSAAVTPGSVRKVLSGQQVHPSQLGLHTQELIRLAHLIDPDTGGVGRDGTIAEVTYTHSDQKAQVTLDDKRANFDALLARLQVVQSVGS